MEELIVCGTEIDEADSELLDRLFREEYAGMVDYARLILSCGSWAEDIVQEVFAIGATKREAVRDSPNRVGWLYLTLQNLVLNKNREVAKISRLIEKISKTPDSVMPKSVPSFEAEVLFNIGYKSLIRESDFEILYAFYCEGHPYKTLAKRYGLSVSGCKMRVKRAKTVLKEIICENF